MELLGFCNFNKHLGNSDVGAHWAHLEGSPGMLEELYQLFFSLKEEATLRRWDCLWLGVESRETLSCKSWYVLSFEG